jgi:hypothetical protein
MRPIAIRSIRSLHTALVILAHATVPSDPREGALDYSGQTHNLKRLLTAFDDAKLIALGFHESSGCKQGCRKGDRSDKRMRIGNAEDRDGLWVADFSSLVSGD